MPGSTAFKGGEREESSSKALAVQITAGGGSLGKAEFVGKVMRSTYFSLKVIRVHTKEELLLIAGISVVPVNTKVKVCSLDCQ